MTNEQLKKAICVRDEISRLKRTLDTLRDYPFRDELPFARVSRDIISEFKLKMKEDIEKRLVLKQTELEKM